MRVRDRPGAIVIEFAIVLPLLMLLAAATLIYGSYYAAV